MRIRRCGYSGLAVSELGLGTLTWGRDTEVHEAEAMLTSFVSAGGNLLELSPTHGDGQAVDVLASLLPVVGRHRTAIVWRGAARLGHDGRWHPSAARGDMLACLDDALERLGTDHVDVWLAAPDPTTPLEETLSALDVAWRSGRTRYVGTTHLGTWDTATARARGATPDGLHGVPVLVEEPFAVEVGGLSVQGRIDAVLRDADGHETVVDWKSGGRGSLSDLQLAIYRLAWAEIAGIPLERIDAAFVLVRTGEVIRPERLLEREDIERLLSGP